MKEIIEIYKHTCHDCGQGLQWTVEGPGCYFVAKDIHQARQLSSLMNTAYAMGHIDSTITICEQMQ